MKKTDRINLRLTKDTRIRLDQLAKEYNVSRTDIIEMIMAGKIDVPKELRELENKEDYQSR